MIESKASRLFERTWELDSWVFGRQAVPYDGLPEIEVDDHLEWLVTPIEQIRSSHYPSESTQKQYRERIEKESTLLMSAIDLLGITVPSSFERVISSFELQLQLLCLTTYFSLQCEVGDSPFRKQDKVIRFMVDEQMAARWYLYLPFDESPFVIMTEGSYRLESLGEGTSNREIDNAKAVTLFCEQTFDRFLKRMWIENTIFFHLHLEIPLDDTQLLYIRRLRPGFIDPNLA